MRRACLAALLLVVATTSSAQELPPSVETAEPSEEAPGLWHIGPAYLTPRFHVWSLGVDTNVFYTATDRQTDFIAHGGPGLEMLVPLHGALKLRADGALGYLWFARTESQRQLTGSARARLGYEGKRLDTGVEYRYLSTFERIGFEVDSRVETEEYRAQADLRYRLGERFGIGLRATGTRIDVPGGQEFFGADLQTNLTRDSLLGTAAITYALTPKTSFLVEADYQSDRFDLAPERDTDSNRLGAGFLIDGSTYLSGRAIGGARSIRVAALPGQDRVVPYADVDLTYHFGPRTRLTGYYYRNVGYSAFSVPEGDLPTLTTQRYGVRIEKGLWSRLDLRLMGGFTNLVSDGSVIIDSGGGPQAVVRDDRAVEAGADLGYTFWNKLRIGFAATYSERRSTVDDLGVDGLLLGGTITFVP
jgi:hypothetical protein